MVTKDISDIGFFEGTEKLLEIWFAPDNSEKKNDLRNIPRKELEKLLKIVAAEIISVDMNEYFDSYVLSESSMFISNNRFIIKTCGITNLLYAVRDILKLAKTFASMNVMNFFYSRRVYHRPEEQNGIHQSFNEEVNYLSEIIPNGIAFVLGENQRNHWYLFTLDNSAGKFTENSDVTLEILMENLDDKKMKNFTKIANRTPEDVIKNSGILQLVPGAVNNGVLFDPIGFSLNGLYKDSYYTIHVTPQACCSYVSFETNIKKRCYKNLVESVLSVFNPGSFIITLFSHKGSLCGNASNQLDHITLNEFSCNGSHNEDLKNYTLAYRHYIRKNT